LHYVDNPSFVANTDSTGTLNYGGIIEKPSKFVVGDRVKLYWKKTSKDDWFCKKCGLGIGLSEYGTSISYSCKKHIPNDSIFPREKLYKYIFNKCLGEVEITGVYKIELAEWHIKIQECGGLAYSTPYPWGSKVSWDLSDRDGFKGNKDMFKYFDENYDLSSPKPFWVYEWGWL